MSNILLGDAIVPKVGRDAPVVMIDDSGMRVKDALCKIGIQSVGVLGISLIAVWHLQSMAAWYHPCLPVGWVVSAAIGAFVSIHDKTLSFYQRCGVVIFWCTLASAVCSAWVLLSPAPNVQGFREYGSEFPFLREMFRFMACVLLFTAISVSIAEGCGFFRRHASRLISSQE